MKSDCDDRRQFGIAARVRLALSSEQFQFGEIIERKLSFVFRRQLEQ